MLILGEMAGKLNQPKMLGGSCISSKFLMRRAQKLLDSCLQTQLGINEVSPEPNPISYPDELFYKRKEF